MWTVKWGRASAEVANDPNTSEQETECDAKENLKKIWESLGLDPEGYLDQPQLMGVCQKIGMDISDDEIEQLFQGLDVDQDGHISFMEFVNLFESMRAALDSSSQDAPIVQMVDDGQSGTEHTVYPFESNQNEAVSSLHELAPSGVFTMLDPQGRG
ncbi:unnamed protein product [Darwinula stevensoni]|uniref:EF-hand domain-containing protein n=1 Tax=Darwinula stevensoni TaxID=69355 RepID=A0A7R8XEU9_9CRUS|nr:unnamed protein product [Darwinula stevensoni]CAG0894834.1 unnamed protein product [Darwinula stevensoni]